MLQQPAVELENIRRCLTARGYSPNVIEEISDTMPLIIDTWCVRYVDEHKVMITINNWRRYTYLVNETEVYEMYVAIITGGTIQTHIATDVLGVNDIRIFLPHYE